MRKISPPPPGFDPRIFLFDSRQRQWIFLCSTASILALGGHLASPGVRRNGVSWPCTYIMYRGSGWVELYLHSSLRTASLLFKGTVQTGNTTLPQTILYWVITAYSIRVRTFCTAVFFPSSGRINFALADADEAGGKELCLLHTHTLERK